jgi:hypothetical protein
VTRCHEYLMVALVQSFMLLFLVGSHRLGITPGANSDSVSLPSNSGKNSRARTRRMRMSYECGHHGRRGLKRPEGTPGYAAPGGYPALPAQTPPFDSWVTSAIRMMPAIRVVRSAISLNRAITIGIDPFRIEVSSVCMSVWKKRSRSLLPRRSIPTSIPETPASSETPVTSAPTSLLSGLATVAPYGRRCLQGRSRRSRKPGQSPRCWARHQAKSLNQCPTA